MKVHVMTATRNTISAEHGAQTTSGLTIYCKCGFCVESVDSQMAVDAVVLAHKIDVLLEAAGIEFTEPDIEIKPVESIHHKRFHTSKDLLL